MQADGTIRRKAIPIRKMWLLCYSIQICFISFIFVSSGSEYMPAIIETYFVKTYCLGENLQNPIYCVKIHTPERFCGGVLLDKHIFVINGSGGVGKDTVCDMAARFWKVQNISSITPILDVARAAGWDGIKTPASRRFLSQLKEICTQFNDLPFRYCMAQLEDFLRNDQQILFVHIREPEEIERFRDAAGERCKAVLVRRPALEQERGALGNRSDDGVTSYVYDGVFLNDGPLDGLAEKVRDFFERLLT